MGKGNHFSGQPLYRQVIYLLNKSKILRFSRENGGGATLSAPIAGFISLQMDETASKDRESSSARHPMPRPSPHSSTEGA